MTPIVRAAWGVGIAALLVVLALVVPLELFDQLEAWRTRRRAP